ncbi:MAG: 50S ribosomal protein L21 [Alphaproteobacteria bacterium]
MHAVIKAGGKQYRVAPADLITVEKLDGEAGAAVSFADVLLVSDGAKTEVGTPHLSGAKVSAEVVSQGLGDKVIIFKKRRRQNSRRKNGHRQPFTVLRITEIAALGKVARADPGEEKAAKPKRAVAKKPKAKKAAEGAEGSEA